VSFVVLDERFQRKRLCLGHYAFVRPGLDGGQKFYDFIAPRLDLIIVVPVVGALAKLVVETI
jgi:hypothetical protein